MEDKYKVIFKIFGKNVKNIREKKGITIQELSKKTGIRKEYLIKIEKGLAYGINTSHIFKLAEGLGTLPYILVEGI